MEFTVKKSAIASSPLIYQEIHKQLKEQGYKVDGCNVLESEPMKVDKIVKGFLFKKTYHRWWWKVVAKVKLFKEETSAGKYQLHIETPFSDDTFKDVTCFLDGLKKRLGELQESIEITFVKVPDFNSCITDDLPIVWY